MRFVCLIYHDLEWFDDKSREELQALHDESMAYDDLLARRGNLVLAQALRPPAQSRAVRRRSGKARITDGPFAETKEQMIGFIVIEAKDMDEAISLAGDVPFARSGTIVVREAYAAKLEGPAG